MKLWTTPLSKQEINTLFEVNKNNGPMIIMEGPIGPMVKLNINGTTFYCGGDSFYWLEEPKFFAMYPQYHQYMPQPEFDLYDMELAEILIEEMKS